MMRCLKEGKQSMKQSKLIIYFATKIKINESFIFSKREGMPVPPLNPYVQLRIIFVVFGNHAIQRASLQLAWQQ